MMTPQPDCRSFVPLDDDPEIRPVVTALLTIAESGTSGNLGATRFLRFSRWEKLVNAVARLILFAWKLHRRHELQDLDCKDTSSNDKTEPPIVEARRRSQNVIISEAQTEAFSEEIACLKKGLPLPKSSPLLKLNPIIDPEGPVLRVGGRLDHADVPFEERHPVILPRKHHISKLIAQRCHEDVQHQGRHFTHGMVRRRGFWIIGGKQLVNNVIYQCLPCRKRRGRVQHQKMADLPPERLTPTPPFTNVGIDVFGPWEVVARRTRGGHVSSKRWAVIFTCFSTRAIHIELIEKMDTSSFINALRRFMAIRGPVKLIRSDCGTNFVGARNELEEALIEMDQKSMESYLASQGCTWVFNPPHASHMGGVWERMIGICRRILDSMFASLKPTRITHEVLSTLMAEVAAIVNNRPLVDISSDPSAPEILTPATILTQKSSTLHAAPGHFVPEDLYSKQWRQVQHLANRFWVRWKQEFLPTLQCRRKWNSSQPNVEVGDLVLLRCKESARNDWPLALVLETTKGEDGKVRKVKLTTAKNGGKQIYDRPVSELILLKREDELKC